MCLFAAITLGEEQETFATSVRAYFSGWVDALAGTLRLTGLTPQESATRALDAVAAIQGGLILARGFGDDETFLGIVDRTEKALLAPAR